MSLARRESPADFPEVSLQLLDPTEARSILYVVRYAESNYPPGRLLIHSDTLALVLALCKGRSTFFTLLSVSRRIFASGFRGGFVISFRWIPSEMYYSEKGSRFFDREKMSKSLLRVLAQHFSRRSPSRAGDQDWCNPSPMHLDGGQVHVPAVSVQSHVPSDDLSSFTEYAAAVSSQWSLVPGTHDCIVDFGLQMSHGSLAPPTRCEPPPGLVGSHILGETQMQRIPAGRSTEASHARSLTEVDEKCPEFPHSGSSSRRQAPVKSESMPEICDPVPGATSGILS